MLEPESLAVVFSPEERRELATRVEFIAPPLTADTWGQGGSRLRDVRLIFSGWGTPVMDQAFLAHFPALEMVFHAAGSVKSFVTDAFWDRGVRVTCAAAMNAIPVAEFTLAQILFSLKHGWQRAREVRFERRFRKEDETMPGAFGATVGLVSLSRTGRLVAQHLKSFDLRVIAYDPLVSAADAARLGVTLHPLEDIFRRADVVSCHTPLLPETIHLLDGRLFSQMKPGSTFINTARGQVVNEAELVATLARRPDLFALLDVTHPEPPAPDSPLFHLPNVIVTPHIAGSLGPECRRLGNMMVAETRRYLSGATLAGEVSRAQLSSLA